MFFEYRFLELYTFDSLQISYLAGILSLANFSKARKLLSHTGIIFPDANLLKKPATPTLSQLVLLD